MLCAIAKAGEAKQITSSEFIKYHNLASSSSVQFAIKKLLEKEVVTEINKAYTVTDKLFARWTDEICGNGYLLE